MAKVMLVLSIFSLMLSVNAQFDYFQMIQQWPPATCSGVGVKCHALPPKIFTIHGLWPSNYSKASLVCTGDELVDVNELKAIRPQLETYWPDVLGGDNESFWKHEWNKHGRCSNPPLNKIQYFQTTLNIRKNKAYDLLAILNAARLGPTTTKTHQYQAIESAIKTKTGKKPGLRCNKNAQTKKFQLFEIILCFDKDGVTLIDCTRSAGITCPYKFVWHSHQD